MRRISWSRVLLMITALAALPLAGQNKWTPAKTPDGQPDLQGVWTFATITPLERPADLAGKQFFTEQEAAAYEKDVLQRTNRDRRDGPADADVSRAYNDFWWDRATTVVNTRRTSLIVDPTDGRIPPLVSEARDRQGETELQRRPLGRQYVGRGHNEFHE